MKILLLLLLPVISFSQSISLGTSINLSTDIQLKGKAYPTTGLNIEYGYKINDFIFTMGYQNIASQDMIKLGIKSKSKNIYQGFNAIYVLNGLANDYPKTIGGSIVVGTDVGKEFCFNPELQAGFTMQELFISLSINLKLKFY